MNDDIKKIEKAMLCRLQCVLMPNGEIICKGKTIGWYENLREFLQKVDEAERIIEQ